MEVKDGNKYRLEPRSGLMAEPGFAIVKGDDLMVYRKEGGIRDIMTRTPAAKALARMAGNYVPRPVSELPPAILVLLDPTAIATAGTPPPSAPAAAAAPQTPPIAVPMATMPVVAGSGAPDSGIPVPLSATPTADGPAPKEPEKAVTP